MMCKKCRYHLKRTTYCLSLSLSALDISKWVFSIYMCIILCQTLLFSQFILHSQDLSSWNPLKVVSCQRKSDKTDIRTSNQQSPTIHPSALSAYVPLLSLPSLIYVFYILCNLCVRLVFFAHVGVCGVLTHLLKSTDRVTTTTVCGDKCTFYCHFLSGISYMKDAKTVT